MTNEIVEGEVISREIVVAAPVTLFQTDEPTEVVEKATKVATALANVIRSQGLASQIQGKEYVRVEGWTLLGTMLGVFPVEDWTRPLPDGIGWEARVEARRGDQVVGAAEAMCTRAEKRWATADDYAIRSMAQTRATAKALRMPLGFVMQLAGYNATPAEEMDFAREAPKGGTYRPERNGAPTPAPTCEVQDHGPCKFIPAGKSRPTKEKPESKPYESFWLCQFPDCKAGWKGRKWSIKAADWDSKLSQMAAENTPKPEVDYGDLPSE